MNKNVNQLKAGVVLSYISMFINTAVSILYTPVMLRLLGQSEYGLYQLTYSVVSYLGLLSFGFGSSYIRFYSQYKAENDRQGIARLNGLFMIVFLAISAITFIAGFFLVINVQNVFKDGLTEKEIETTRLLMVFMVFNIAVSFPTSVFDAYITANERYVFQRLLYLVRSIFNPFLSLPLLLLGFKSLSLVLVTTILSVANLIINAWYCIKKLRIQFIFSQFDVALFKNIFAFSFFIFLNMITDQINWSIDRVILGRYGGTLSVAVYSVGAQINGYYTAFSTAVSSVFIPRINRIVAVNDNSDSVLTDLFIRVGRLQFVILSYIVCGFIILGKFFISIWAGTGYDESYLVALLLIIPVTIPCIQNIGIEIQRAKNMHRFRSIAYVIFAMTNLFISIPLAKLFGTIGAAFGTMISLVLGNGLLMNWYYYKYVKLDIPRFWNEILKMLPTVLIPSALIFIISLYIPVSSLLAFIIYGTVFTICFSLSMWFFALNSYEKNVISKPFKFIMRKLRQVH
jgi:O-antigen/teichoic acid export membrane protein